MSRFAGALVALVCLSLAGSAGAQKPPPPAKKGQANGQQKKMEMPPKPATELEQLEILEGNWNCEGTQAAGIMGPERKFKAKAKAEKSLDGHWYTARYEEQKSGKGHAMTTSEQWGWDSADRNYVRVVFDNMGGWTVYESPGWEGDKLVWTGEGSGMGQKMQARDTFTRKGDKNLTVQIEIQQQGQWQTISTINCKR